jgi:hypothetical protein
MVLPFTPLTIYFQDVSYYVDTPAVIITLSNAKDILI